MEWTLAGLFVISILLFVFSSLKSVQASKAEQQRIDQVHVLVMKEINDMQESIRNMNLDIEVVMKEAGVQLSPAELVLAREILDLYKRNYSISSIAEMKQVPASEVEQFLAPFQNAKTERGQVVHAN